MERGKTIDVETFIKNLININFSDDERTNELIESGDIFGLIKYINQENNSLKKSNAIISVLIKKSEKEKEELESDIEAKAEELFKDKIDKYSKLEMKYDELVKHVDFVRDLFGRQ